MNSKTYVGALGAALFAAACGNGQLPTSPSVSAGAAFGRLNSETGVSGPFEMRSLAGRVINVLSGAAAPGVTLAIDGVGSAAADGSGAFTLESEAPDGL